MTVDSAVYARINSGGAYLLDAHGHGALKAVVPALPDSVRASWHIGEQLGIRGGRCRSRPGVRQGGVGGAVTG